ncbi:hypothetical protein BV898_19664, partial [Hypsibius exemplaris]
YNRFPELAEVAHKSEKIRRAMQPDNCGILEPIGSSAIFKQEAVESHRPAVTALIRTATKQQNLPDKSEFNENRNKTYSSYPEKVRLDSDLAAQPEKPGWIVTWLFSRRETSGRIALTFKFGLFARLYPIVSVLDLFSVISPY